jgi:hypothetical protein
LSASDFSLRATFFTRLSVSMGTLVLRGKMEKIRSLLMATPTRKGQFCDISS